MSSVGQARSSLTPGEVSAAGAASGAVTRLVCQPLDVAKIRLQLQVELGQARKYKNLIELMLKLPREEGVAALWKGHVPAQLLSISYGFASFAVFESLTASLNQNQFISDHVQYRPLVHFICGGLGGCAGTVASFPFDVVRTRLVAQRGHVYSGTRDAGLQLYTSGGIAAFYRGFVPACLSVAPQSGLQFGLYSMLTQLLGSIVTSPDTGLISVQGSLICGALAGVATKTILYPLDVVKKRLQVSGWSEGREGLGKTAQYRNMRECFVMILRQEGGRSLYKGFTPALVKAVTTTSIHFTAYEWICKVFLLRHKR